MDDDAIRALLGAVPIASLVRTPPGYVAILRARIDAQPEADSDAVADYIARHGGRVEKRRLPLIAISAETTARKFRARFITSFQALPCPRRHRRNSHAALGGLAKRSRIAGSALPLGDTVDTRMLGMAVVAVVVVIVVIVFVI
jgi:hypothetical protein